jgi:hypothetical protein
MSFQHQSTSGFVKLFSYAITGVLLTAFIVSCSNKSARHFSFAFYNVENLFDTVDDPRIRDNSHLPDSKVPWTTARYMAKLDNLARVMTAVDSGSYPALFGLCEVENAAVVDALTNHPDLRPAGYQILHKDSPDGRGIDVALLYQEQVFTPVETTYIRPVFPIKPESTTRDILYTKGVIFESDTLHIFVNHWVSRWGGQEETEPYRRYIGQLLKRVTDSILRVRPKANIIIAGDLNDNPDDISISSDLGAMLPGEKFQKHSLYNLSWKKYNQGEGTLYYRSWDMFDQVIVSGSMLTGKNGVKLESQDQQIVKYDWMLYQPEKGPARPNRTAGSKSYYGGYSDHLPIFVRMTAK